MLGGWFKKKLQAALREMHDTPPEIRRTTATEEMFGRHLPAVIAFKINNGFVVQANDSSHVAQYGEVRSSGFTFCKDAEAIAEHIVSSAVREKIGIQQEMFGQSIPAMLQKQSVVGSGGSGYAANNIRKP
jgi:hypothetical protein